MNSPSRFAPSTQLDALRASLAGYVEGDATFPARFESSLVQVRQLALPEIGQRLARNTTPLALRRYLIETARLTDWPEWDRHLVTALLQEEDLSLFAEGCEALGALCTRGAL